jgi:hypothetical protein
MHALAWDQAEMLAKPNVRRELVGMGHHHARAAEPVENARNATHARVALAAQPVAAALALPVQTRVAQRHQALLQRKKAARGRAAV